MSSNLEVKDSSIARALTPYILLCALLVAGKFLLSELQWSIGLQGGIKHSLGAFNPGIAFITTIAILALIHPKGRSFLIPAASKALASLPKPLATLACLVGLVQLYLISGSNLNGLPSVTQLLAQAVSTTAFPFFAPFVGAFGTFLAGSATVSNLLFGGFSLSMSESLKLSSELLLSLQVLGAAVGNMVSLSTIVAAKVAIGGDVNESSVLAKTAVPCFILLTAIGLLGLFLSNFSL